MEEEGRKEGGHKWDLASDPDCVTSGKCLPSLGPSGRSPLYSGEKGHSFQNAQTGNLWATTSSQPVWFDSHSMI